MARDYRQQAWDTADRRAHIAAVAAWLAAAGLVATPALVDALDRMRAAAYTAGAQAAGATTEPEPIGPSATDPMDGARLNAARALTDADTIDAAAAGMVDALADPGHADTVALTETVAAVSAGALWAYRQAGVAQVRWVTDGAPCPECVAREEAGPMPADTAIAPPLHPRCKCSIEPA